MLLSEISRRLSISTLIACVSAAPWKHSSRYATHRVRQLSDKTLESYHPATTYRTFGPGVASPLKKRGESGTLEENAASFIKEELNVSADGFRIRSSASTDAGGHVWAQQLVNGIPVSNAVVNVAFNKADNVVAFGANFGGSSLAPAQIAPPTPSISKEAAITSAEQSLQGKHNGWPPSLEYYVQPSGNLALSYVVEVLTADGDHWYEAFVNALDGTVLGTNDFVAGDSYRAVDPRVNDITKGYKLFENPADVFSSPNGWHTLNGTASTDTSGNNVITYKGDLSQTTQQSADGRVFDYPYDLTLDPTAQINVKAAAVNTFFISNTIHDINYRYGFTEKTFNFQDDNFDKGGQGNDRILISTQDGSGTNNANFATPADGRNGRMRMYVWTQSTPKRDGDLSNDIIAHEQTHGTTNRMTGGGTGRCLQTTESGGMGEGWSDAFADWLVHTDASTPDFVLSPWASNKTFGLRTHPYSTNSTTNPLIYSNIAQLSKVHRIGEVWANILHNVYAELVNNFGWAADAFTNADSNAGNVVFLRNFMDGLLLQPCNPTFLQARDAWIQADQNRYKGAHVCSIWKAFASRGMGVGATSTFVDSFVVPKECQVSGTTSTETGASTTTVESSTSNSTSEPTVVPTNTE